MSLKRLLCRHDYERVGFCYSYYDYFGFLVFVYVVRCKKCDKLTVKKYWQKEVIPFWK